MPDTGVKTLRGDDMHNYLKRHPTVLYRYQPNTPGFFFLLGLAIIAGAIGVWLWADAGLATVWHSVAIGALMATSVTLTMVVAYWTYFTRIHWVAASDQHLLIGRGDRVTAIEWASLEVDNLEFAADGDDRFLGVLSLKLGDRRYQLRLFNGFAVLKNLQGFIQTLLTHVQQEAA